MDAARVAESEAAVDEVVAGDPEAALAIALGRAYHQSGVASDQLEELMQSAAVALRLELQVTALPTSIMAALGPAYAQKIVLLRLEPGVIDLRRLALLNAVYERILHERPSPVEALAEIQRITALRQSARAVPTIAAYCVLSVGASVILGGHEPENVAAALIGLATGALAVLGRAAPAIDRLFEVLAAFVATLIASVYAERVHHLAIYIALVAGVVQLLPGLQLTAALHELAYRNLVAGTARLGSVLMTLLSLGCGFALGVALAGPGQMHVEPMLYGAIPWWQIALAVIAVASGIAVLENARPSDYPLVLASCAAAEVAYRLFALLPGHQVATFGAALTVGVFTAIGARYARIPQAVLLVPGLLILVPGSLSYESILLMLQSNGSDAAAIAVNAIVAAIEIVAGLLLAQLFFSPVHRHPVFRARP